MSLELYAFVDSLPDRATWQSAIDRTGIDLQLDPELDLRKDEGFSPCQLQGASSGFELFVSPASVVLRDLPSVAAVAGSRPHVICCRWGGDLAESACVLGANLALARALGGVIYDPAEGAVLDDDALEKELRECLAET
jgi:hypothetical protein